MWKAIKVYDNGIHYKFYGMEMLRVRYYDEEFEKTLFRNGGDYNHVVLKKRGIDYDVVVEHEGQKIYATMSGIIFSRHTAVDALKMDLVSGNYVLFDEIDDAVLYTENKFFHTLQYAYKYTHIKSIDDVHFFQAKIAFALPETEIFED